MRRNGVLACLCATGVVLAGADARAVDVELTADTVGQAYQLRAGTDALVNRRRLTQLVGLGVHGIGPKDALGRPRDRDQLYLVASLRVDAELGDYAELLAPSGRTPDRELRRVAFEILYAYAGGRSLGGFLDLRLGRQVVVELFQYRSFDGLAIEARTPVHLALEAWGGLGVTGASPVDSPVYRVDGVALGGNPRASLPARQEDALMPTFGLALKTDGIRDVTARVSYLRTASFTGARAPGEPGSGVVEEQVGFTARARLFSRLFPWLGLRHNLLVGRLDHVEAGVRLALGRHGVQAEYLLSVPTFDGDSIWNVFGTQAFDDVRLGYDVALGRLRLSARGFARLFGQEQTSFAGALPPAGLARGLALGAAAGGRIAFARGFARLDAYYEDGYGGRLGGVDLSTRVRVAGDGERGVEAEGRISYAYFRDDARPLSAAHSLGLQAGARYVPTRGVTLHLLVEENVNRFALSQLRLLALLDLSFWLGTRAPGGVGRPPHGGLL